MPRVAVVIPCYNRAHCIADAVQSALDQTRPPERIVVVNDGSTDPSNQVLAGFGKRITVIDQPNAGVAAARNTGVAAADDCDLIAFLDSDDVWDPGKLERQLPLHDRADVVLSASNWAWADRPDEPEYERLGIGPAGVGDEPALATLLRFEGHGFWLPTWIVRRDALCRVGGFDPRMKRVEDTRVLFRLSFEGCFAICEQVGTLRSSQVDSVQLTDTASAAYQADYVPATIEVLLETYARAWRLESALQQRLRRFAAYYLLSHAKLLAAAGDRAGARRRAREALAFGAAGRHRLQALVLWLVPGAYVRLSSRRSIQ
ncbi:MAG: glycosyltransferase [Planctomycetes bacterium]|jgi:glycosyltransferase involved in cell wall biosynthesis|nr:glycosyltransferase [Planctomycetota bacterium]